MSDKSSNQDKEKKDALIYEAGSKLSSIGELVAKISKYKENKELKEILTALADIRDKIGEILQSTYTANKEQQLKVVYPRIDTYQKRLEQLIAEGKLTEKPTTAKKSTASLSDSSLDDSWGSSLGDSNPDSGKPMPMRLPGGPGASLQSNPSSRDPKNASWGKDFSFPKPKVERTPSPSSNPTRVTSPNWDDEALDSSQETPTDHDKPKPPKR